LKHGGGAHSTIELARAALIADKIAEGAQFFSFRTVNSPVASGLGAR
jgi:hypothetical protein